MNKFWMAIIVFALMFSYGFDEPPWDKSSISVDGECLFAGVSRFTITNGGEPGEGDMDGPTIWEFYVEDNLVSSGELQLKGGESMTMDFGPYLGMKVTLIVYQRPGHPGNSVPQASLTCGTIITLETPTPVPSDTPAATFTSTLPTDPTATPNKLPTYTPTYENTETPTPLLPATGDGNNFFLVALAVLGVIMLFSGLRPRK